MTLRTDHVAGALAIVAGLLLFVLSADLPFGTLSFPGAGMWPKLICALMIGLGLLLLMRAGASTPLAALDWGDLRHAAIVAGATAAAVALYPAVGFIVSMSLLLIGLVLLERRRPLFAAIFGIGSSVAVYALFTMLLKAPLERGLIGF
jgi:putative tricarboxylic transport membrane protein